MVGRVPDRHRRFQRAREPVVVDERGTQRTVLDRFVERVERSLREPHLPVHVRREQGILVREWGERRFLLRRVDRPPPFREQLLPCLTAGDTRRFVAEQFRRRLHHRWPHRCRAERLMEVQQQVQRTILASELELRPQHRLRGEISAILNDWPERGERCALPEPVAGQVS